MTLFALMYGSENPNQIAIVSSKEIAEQIVELLGNDLYGKQFFTIQERENQ